MLITFCAALTMSGCAAEGKSFGRLRMTNYFSKSNRCFITRTDHLWIGVLAAWLGTGLHAHNVPLMKPTLGTLKAKRRVPGKCFSSRSV